MSIFAGLNITISHQSLTSASSEITPSQRCVKAFSSYLYFSLQLLIYLIGAHISVHLHIYHTFLQLLTSFRNQYTLHVVYSNLIFILQFLILAESVSFIDLFDHAIRPYHSHIAACHPSFVYYSHTVLNT